MQQRISLAERFWKQVIKNEDGCWDWRGGKDGHGYGVTHAGGHGGRTLKAHRVSWELHYGPIPEGADILHRCDNPPCTRPDHLFVGDARTNTRDMIAKGRQRCPGPKRSSWARYTEEQVREARRRYGAGGWGALSRVAREMQMSITAVWMIVHRKTWKNVV